jgi:hypothetical protein
MTGDSCPNCGYCKHCGRSDSMYYRIQPLQPAPWTIPSPWANPDLPTTYPTYPWLTSTTTGTDSNFNYEFTGFKTADGSTVAFSGNKTWDRHQ